MLRYPPTNRRRCRCGSCPRCQSKLTDNYTDQECEAYNWLKQNFKGRWGINNVTMLVNNQFKLLEFAKMHGYVEPE